MVNAKVTIKPKKQFMEKEVMVPPTSYIVLAEELTIADLAENIRAEYVGGSFWEHSGFGRSQ